MYIIRIDLDCARVRCCFRVDRTCSNRFVRVEESFLGSGEEEEEKDIGSDGMVLGTGGPFLLTENTEWTAK
jgi:hypothetical protein